MDTRRAVGSRDRGRPAAEHHTDTATIDLVELVELRYGVTLQHGTGLGGLVYVVALLGVLTVIAVLAIATSSGWSVLKAWG